jgi:GNAT superfamily N-acetyltransferase
LFSDAERAIGVILHFSSDKNVPREDLVALFVSLEWSSAKYPERLELAISQSHTVRTLWDGDLLVGLVSAISDGAMCVYFPYVAIRPEYQGKGWGRALLAEALAPYEGFHHAALISYGDKSGFYERCGFSRDTEKAVLFFKAAEKIHADAIDIPAAGRA